MDKFKKLPISSIYSRNYKRNAVFEDGPKSYDYRYVLECIKEQKDYKEKVRKFIYESLYRGCNRQDISRCINILEQVKTIDKQCYNENLNSLLDLYSYTDLKTMNECYATIDDAELKESLAPILQEATICDRVLNNHKSINKRFNTDSVKFESQFSSLSESVDTMCKFLDTYDITINKKIGIALEECLYLNNGACDNKAILSNVLEFYLARADVITDYNYNKVKSVLENCSFLTDSDLKTVSYIFENRSFNQIVKDNAAREKNKDFKKLLEAISKCKTLKAAEIVIGSAFTLIYGSFVVVATVAFSSVAILLSSLFALTLTIPVAPLVIIEKIKQSNKEINERAQANLDDRAIERALDVDMMVKDNIEKCEDPNTVMESCADIILNTIVEKQPQPILEEYANSDDVKSILNSYKAEQRKSIPLMKRTLTRVFTKKPSAIIDDTPAILNFIRKFAILSMITVGTAPIGTALALVTFCADRYIQLGMQRKEAEKVCNYFNAEKKKVEKQIAKTKDGDEKANLEKYLESLNKAIIKLEEYRDDLYSEEELDKRNGLEEDDDGKTEFEKLFEESSTAFCQDAATYLAAEGYTLYHIIYNLLDLAAHRPYLYDYKVFDINNERVDNVINNIDEKMFEYNFVSPNGIISIPLVAIRNTRDDSIEQTLTLIETMRGYLINNGYINYTIYAYDRDEYTVISLTCFDKIFVEKEVQEFSILPDLKDGIADIMFVESAFDEMNEELSASTLVADLNTNIHMLVPELEEVLLNLEFSGLDYESFTEAVLDYKEGCGDYIEKDIIETAISNHKTTVHNHSKEDIYLQLEANRNLRNKVKNLKDSKEAKKAKETASKVKSSAGNIANKTKEGALVVSTNLKLASEAMKKATQDLSSKEKELSKSVDVNMSMFKRNLEKALTNNRREAIIKGSVIPSFSKMLKVCMATGAAWAVNPGLAVIGAVAGLAVSKSLNRKERMALLDEVAVEMKIVDKEIENCDPNDKEKYKALLTYQRKLKREYDRIKYRLERIDEIDTEEDDDKE